LGALSPFIFETIGKNRDATIDFRAGYPTSAMLAGNEPALTVAGIAICEVRRLAEHRHAATRRIVQHALVGNVAEQKAV